MRLVYVALVVRDYDEAIAYFTQKLGFGLVKNKDLGGGKRWIRVSPPDGGIGLLLAKAVTDEQRNAIGNAGGGRVAFFLEVADFDAAYRRLQSNGVAFAELPRREPYGSVVVFSDLYGNRWDLIGPVDVDAGTEE